MKTTKPSSLNATSLHQIPGAGWLVLLLTHFSASLFLSPLAPAADFGGFLKGVAREATERAAKAAAQKADESLKQAAKPTHDKKAAPLPRSQPAVAPQPVSPLAVRASAPMPSVDRAALTSVVYTTVAMSDSFSYPGSSERPGKVRFVGPPVINNNGVVAFKANFHFFAKSVPSHVDGVFLGTPGNLRMISSSGTPLPGLQKGAGVNSDLYLDNADNLALRVQAQRIGSRPIALSPTIWQSATGQPVFSQEDRGLQFRDFQMADGGMMCGTALVNGPGKKMPAAPGLPVVWVYENGRMSIIAKGGEHPPGLAASLRFVVKPFKMETGRVPMMNRQGDVLFEFPIEGPGITREEECLWLYRKGEVKLLARQNEKALPLEEKFVAFHVGRGALNASGQVCFLAEIEKQSWGIWRAEPGKLELLVKDGGPRPGSTLPNQVGLNSGSIPALLDDGRTVLAIGDGACEIWAFKPGGSELIFQSRDAYRGAASELTVKASGMMAFKTDQLWAGEPGNFHPLVRRGQEIEVAPGDARKVLEILNLGEVDRATSSPLNDRGQVVLHLSFEGVREKHDPAQGIIIATLPSRPSATLTVSGSAGGGSTGTARSVSPANPSHNTAQPVDAAANVAVAPVAAMVSATPASSAVALLPSPWRPNEKRAWGRPVLLKETPIDISKLAWPSAETKLAQARWLPVSSNRWASRAEHVCFSDDLRHVTYVAQKAIGQMVLVKDGIEGPGFDRIHQEVRLSADFGYMAYEAERSGKRFFVHVTPQGQRVYEYLKGEAPTYLPKHEELRASDDLRHVFALITVANSNGAGRGHPRSHTFLEVDGIRQTSPITCEPRQVRFTKGHVVQRGAKGETIADGHVVAGGQTGLEGMYWSSNGKHRLDLVRKPGRTGIEVWLNDRVLAAHENADLVFPDSVVFSPDQSRVAYVVRSSSQVAVMLNGQRFASYPPTASVKGVCFSPESTGLAYWVKYGGTPQRIVVVANGHEGTLEEHTGDLRIWFGPNSGSIAYLFDEDPGRNPEGKLVINGAARVVTGEKMSALAFTLEGKHVIGMGRRSVMADGTPMAITADRIWNLQADGADRFSVFVCRGRNPQGIPTEFARLEFQILAESAETPK